MSFGPDPVQAEFCVSIVCGSYRGDGKAGSCCVGAVQRQSVTDPDPKTYQQGEERRVEKQGKEYKFLAIQTSVSPGQAANPLAGFDFPKNTAGEARYLK